MKSWVVIAVGPRRPVLIRSRGASLAAGLRAAALAFPNRTAAAWVFRGSPGRQSLAGLFLIRGKRARKLNPDPFGGRVDRKEWRAFKTGMDYQDVYRMLWRDDDDSSTWAYKRRGTVLGMWHRIKLDLWAWANQRPEDPAMLVVEGSAIGVPASEARAALRGARLAEVEEDVPF